MHKPPNVKFVSWLGRMATDLTEDGMIQQVELWHAVDGDGGERLSTIKMEDRPPDEDHETLAIELWNDALHDASTRPEGSTQRYAVRVYRAQDPNPEDSYSFLLPGTAITSLVGSDTESPTPKGLLAQEMRQTNTLHAMVIRMCEATAGSTARQLEQERAENAELREKARASMKLEQDLLDRQHERNESRVAREKRDERLDSLLTAAVTMAPMILSKVFESRAAQAPALGPGQIDPSELGKLKLRNQAVGSLLQSLSAEQVQTLMGIFDPNQQLGMMQIYESYRDEHEKKNQPSPPSADTARKGGDHSPEEERHGHN